MFHADIVLDNFSQTRQLCQNHCQKKNADDEKEVILKRRNESLGFVKEKINEILDPSKSNYESSITAKYFLAICKISTDDYNWALSFSGDADFELHL